MTRRRGRGLPRTCSGSARSGNGRSPATPSRSTWCSGRASARSSSSSSFSWRCSRCRSSARRIWVGFDPGDVAHGLVRVEMPGKHGAYAPCTSALAMIGAVGGSLMNLAYPYFLDAKGWRGPQYRRVQLYDFCLGIVAMLVLNLSVWMLGAELLYPGPAHPEPRRSAEPAEHGARRDRARCSSTPGSSRRSTRRSSATRPGWAGSARTPGSAGTPALGPITQRLPASRLLSLDRVLVPRDAARLDDAGDAGLRHADAGRQQRAGRAAAAARWRPVVDHRERRGSSAASTAIAGGKTS